MHNLRKGIPLVVALVFFGLTAAPTILSGTETVAAIDEILLGAPQNARLVFENEHVWVIEYTLLPGDRLPVHGSGDHSVYALSDYTINYIENYEPEQQSWKNGQTGWHPLQAHEVENAGETPARFLAVSRKSTSLPRVAGSTTGKSVTQVAPRDATKLFENGSVRITEVLLEPNEKQPAHWGYARVIFALSSPIKSRPATSRYVGRPERRTGTTLESMRLQTQEKRERATSYSNSRSSVTRLTRVGWSDRTL